MDPGDVITLVVSWHFNAAAMCEFSRQEFVKGMASLGCDSAEQLRRILPRLRAELEDPDRFKVRCLPSALFSSCVLRGLPHAAVVLLPCTTLHGGSSVMPRFCLAS